MRELRISSSCLKSKLRRDGSLESEVGGRGMQEDRKIIGVLKANNQKQKCKDEGEEDCMIRC